MKIDRAFWSRFARTYWERKPGVFCDVESPIRDVDEGTIFELLVAYSDRCRREESIEGIKFFVDGQACFEHEVLESLPVARDKTLAGYHARVSKRLADYCLVCDELMRIPHEKWGRVRDFVSELYGFVGMPVRFTEIGLYLGNYRRTPFGVHVDGCGVISVPVIGEKRFRLWEPKYVERHPDLKEAFEYSAHRKQSTLLEVAPGDLAYWPSTSWHIAESDGSFNTTWSIGYWLNQPYSELLGTILASLAAKALGPLADLRTIPLSTGVGERDDELPDLLLETVERLSRIDSVSLQEALATVWNERRARAGFKIAPHISHRAASKL